MTTSRSCSAISISNSSSTTTERHPPSHHPTGGRKRSISVSSCLPASASLRFVPSSWSATSPLRHPGIHFRAERERNIRDPFRDHAAGRKHLLPLRPRLYGERVRVRGSADFARRGSNYQLPYPRPMPTPCSHSLPKKPPTPLIHPSHASPIIAPSLLRETWCAPGIREGRRCRIGRMTVCDWAMSPQVRALIGAFSVSAAPDRARPPDGWPQGRITYLNERPNGRPSSRPLRRGLLFDNGQGRKAAWR